MNRRQWLRTCGAAGAVGVVLMSPLRVLASVREVFKADAADEVVAKLIGARPMETSDRIKVKAPELAQNGAVVAVKISTDLPDVSAISIVIDENPNPLTARFEISPDSFAEIATRVKMGKSSNLQVLVETADKVYVTSRQVKVGLGGCGG